MIPPNGETNVIQQRFMRRERRSEIWADFFEEARQPRLQWMNIAIRKNENGGQRFFCPLSGQTDVHDLQVNDPILGTDFVVCTWTL